jgi:hypothetical protein
MSSTYLAFGGQDEKEHLLRRGEESHTKRVPECLMLRNHSIIVIIFSPIDFKKEARNYFSETEGPAAISSNVQGPQCNLQ